MKKHVLYHLGRLLAYCADSRAQCANGKQGQLEAAALQPRWQKSSGALLDEFAALSPSARALYFISRSFEADKDSLAVDATQTVSYPYNTGIQRVTREILRPLAEQGLRVIPFKHYYDSHVAVCLNSLERGYLYDYHEQSMPLLALAETFSSLIRKPIRSMFLRFVSLFVDDVESRREMARGYEEATGSSPKGVIFKLVRWLFPECQLLTFGLRVLVAEVVLSQARINYYRTRTDGWTKIFFILHDLLPLEQPEFFGADPLYNEFVGLVNSCAGVICESETTRASFERWQKAFSGTSKTKVSCAYLASSFDQLVAPVSDASTARGICVGTFEPRKNQIGVLLAAARLHRVGIPIHMTFVGNPGWKSSDFFAAKSALDPKDEFSSIKIALNDMQLRDEYRKADFFVQTSFGEGFGLPALEGLSQGKPGVVSQGGSLSEISRVCGGCIECDPTHPNAIETALREIVKVGTRRTLVSQIKNVDKFSWMNFAQAIDGLIKAVG